VVLTYTTGDALHESIRFVQQGEIAFAALLVLAFAIGAIPFGVLVARRYGVDIRSQGSGNTGAANALRTLGKKAGALVLVLDALKGFAPTFLAVFVNLSLVVRPGLTLHGETLATMIAGAAILGHCFSPWLRFRGGKGVATNFGAVFALAWPAGIGFMIVWVLTLYACGFASVASMLASFAMAPLLWFLVGDAGFWYGLLSALFIAWKHRENIDRLRARTESKLSLFRGKSRA
jgi:glycerol-3-phosphate acyltransferase PlsY